MEQGYKFGKSECPICGKIVADNWYIRHLKKEHPTPDNSPELCIACRREPIMDRPGARICSVCFVRRMAELLDDDSEAGKMVSNWLLEPIKEYDAKVLTKRCE